MMKKMIALMLAGFMVFSLAACSGGDKKEEETTQEETAQEDAEEETLVYISSGRLSAIAPPEGWEQEPDDSENELVYNKLDAEDGEILQLWIDIDSYDSPEVILERTKEGNKDLGKECEEEERTIGGIDFLYLIPEYGYNTLYGTKDGVTIMISHDQGISLDDEGVQDIINSIIVAPEEE
jgi:hypothetical protein